jgi:acyl-homoserine lactone acylase PvdQ
MGQSMLMPTARHRYRIRLLSKAAAFAAFVFVCIFPAPVVAQEPQTPNDLWQQATLYRDEWGVPHIQADNLGAMAFAFGYAQAEDHIEAMLRAYRIANGRAAEVLGPDFAQSDEFSIKMAHATLAENAYAIADDATRMLCEGFSLGVNTWIIDHPGAAPVWSDGMRPEDILALMHSYLMSFAPLDVPGIYARTPASQTGNAWAVGPSRSATGETLLVINPHTDFRSQFQWYEAQLTAGDYNVIGATLFGLPVLLQGHNGMLGWALTPNSPDFADVYVEAVQQQENAVHDPANPTLGNNDNAEGLDLELSRTLQIIAHTKPYYVMMPGGLEERQVTCVDTENGPYIGQIGGRLTTWQIGGYRDFGALAQLLDMGRARDLSTFQAAWGQQQIPCFHLIYADRAGNLFYHYNARVGDKYWPVADQFAENGDGSLDPQQQGPAQSPIDWTRPVSANNSLFKWGPYASPAELPALTNPASGYLQACATTPWGVTEQNSIKPDKWPGWLIHDTDSLRANRVKRLLTFGLRSYQDMQAMLYDVLVPSAVVVVPKLIEAADASGEWAAQAHPDLAPGLDTLRNWNYVADTTSQGMTFYHVYWATLKSMAPASVGEDALLMALSKGEPDAQELSLRAAEQTARLLRTEFGSVAVPWGDAHRFFRGKQSVAAAGSGMGDAVFVASAAEFTDKVWRVNYGYGYAMAVKFGETVDTASVVPFGASENPDSPHYADQLDLLSKRRMKVVRSDPEEVRRYAKSAYGSSVRFSPMGVPASGIVHSGSPVAVSSTMYTQSPAQLPLGLATFTMYTRVMIDPADAPVAVDMDVYIPPELCSDEHLPSLVAYAYDEESGWSRLDAQEIDPATRILRFRDRSARTYAVLGPSEYRAIQEADVRDRVALTIPDSAIRERLPRLSSIKSADGPPPLVPGAPGFKEAKQQPVETAPSASEVQAPPSLDDQQPTAAAPATEPPVAPGTGVEPAAATPQALEPQAPPLPRRRTSGACHAADTGSRKHAWPA